MRNAILNLFSTVFALLLLPVSLPVMAAGQFEGPVVFKAAEVVPADIPESELYRIHDQVLNDGFLNAYTVESAFGEWKISSNALLGTRLAEIVAMSKMREIAESDSFEDAIEDDADEVAEGFKNLVDDPKGALEGAASGVRKMFAITGEAWKSRHTREDESSMKNLGNAISGYDKAKREYAAQFGVDPYSLNQALHEELDRIARAASGGSMVGTVFKALIPGGVGAIIAATNLTHSLNELVTASSEVELRIINREKLAKMGIDAALIERFLDDSRATPTHKTYLAGALELMHGVGGRDLFLDYAIAPPTEEVALYRTLSAVMYAWYHENEQKLDRFVQAGSTAVGIDGDNQLVVQAPLDHLLWTEPLATVIEALDEVVAAPGKVSGKQIWLSGTASERAVTELGNRGWKVRQQVSVE